MTFFEDLSNCDYFGDEFVSELIAIGWLTDGSRIFVCPEVILHYIACHHYRPPDPFLAAIAACPDTNSMDYKKLLLASGGRKLLGF